MEDAQEIEDKPSENKHETCHEMLSRHRREITQLHNKEIELKKAAAEVRKEYKETRKKGSGRSRKIAESTIISDRAIENEKLEKKFQPLVLTINEIKPDERCLYQAIEDQLALVYGGSFPDVEMGKEYKSNRESGSPDSSIRPSHHKHAFGIGEHYNSVVPNLCG
ncbi:hypothetical protein FEM48_Zijuj11G0060900 [Ziziphus jujuba var. spinosa]|uniref:OTU domain-containing protein 6B-like n=1 Tax=Ziziphus jujuba var. spinosa TaxID=714518 RepID=A0A978UH95_ZIZJJ|nr:hypothetical protein FEM48_Zijuj11G0060900 [Ziziphus jujuba var. spinosa]